MRNKGKCITPGCPRQALFFCLPCLAEMKRDLARFRARLDQERGRQDVKRKPTTFGAMAARGANVVRYICDGGITTTSCGRVITRSTERIPTCCGFPMRLASDAEAESIPVDVRGRPKKPKPAAAPTKRGIPTRRKTE